MITLKRAQLGKCAEAVDITVKSGAGRAKDFAHSWEMVLGFKNGTINWQEYVSTYRKKLSKVDKKSWLWLKSQAVDGILVLGCYCPDGFLCHTHVLIDYLLEVSRSVIDGRGDDDC